MTLYSSISKSWLIQADMHLQNKLVTIINASDFSKMSQVILDNMKITCSYPCYLLLFLSKENKTFIQ